MKKIVIYLSVFLSIAALIYGAALPAVIPLEPPGSIAVFTGEPVKPVSVSATESDLPWYLGKIEADKAWQVTGGGNGIIVAVLDTGIDVSHEELSGKVISSVNFSSSKTVKDVNGHGTVVAGIITASIEKSKGIFGMAYNSSLLNVKVANDNGFVYPEAVASGITWAANNNANVINLSLTLSKPSDAVEKAVAYAWSKGCIIVAAAGNAGGISEVYPAAYPNVIAVAATDQNDELARWSNHGNWINVSAPGTDIFSTLPGNKYAYQSGTSFAVPLVSGEAALLISLGKGDNGQVRAAILDGSVADIEGLSINRIDAYRAVEEVANK